VYDLGLRARAGHAVVDYLELCAIAVFALALRLGTNVLFALTLTNTVRTAGEEIAGGG